MAPVDYSSLKFKTIAVSASPAIATVTLNRPSRLNAFTKEMTLELETIFGLLSEDERVRVVVLTGAGSAFCAGADLSAATLTTPLAPKDHRDEGGRVSLSIYRCKKPVIAAINGHAVGIGITMTLPCTIRITHSSAKIAFPFVGRGLVPEAASAWFLPRLIGLSRASHILTTGETLPAGDKLLEGLFSEVLAKPEDVLLRAYSIAEKIATQASAVSAYLVKAMLFHTPSTPEETHLLDSRLLGELYNGPDKQEGVDAFLQKRAPNFTASVEKDLPLNVPWWQAVDTKVTKFTGKL
ncbi:ClpP/crotonase [Wilcoxina mikolae CBS 423.85]|nr:ClpP/crotonase [Wilcoxina mikolae CBS 423.85]